MRRRIIGFSILGLVLGVSFAANTFLTNRSDKQPTQSYIVQAASLQQARGVGEHLAAPLETGIEGDAAPAIKN